jgi:hypothetical protein
MAGFNADAIQECCGDARWHAHVAAEFSRALSLDCEDAKKRAQITTRQGTST